MSADARIEELGIDLSQPSSPIANYVPCVRVGNLLFLSGNGPRRGGSSEMVTGKLGRDLSVEEGYEAARLVGIQLLAAIKNELGTLDAVERCVKALGMVNGTPDFTQQPSRNQRLLRPDGRSLRRKRQTRPIRCRYGQPAKRHRSRNRTHSPTERRCLNG